MDRLDIAGACNALPPFIEALNNWYIRRSRDALLASREGRRQAGRLRHALHRAGHALPDDGAVPALRHRAHPPRARAMARACICRTGRMRRALAVDAGAGRADGPRARGLLGGGLDPHGEEPPQPPAAPQADRRPSAPRDPRAAPRRHRRGGERQGGRLRRRPDASSAPRCWWSIRASSASVSARR